MKRLLVIFGWISVIVTAAFLRFEGLSDRPFHADEATGARILEKRLEHDGGNFDPKHYHGPLLADLAIPWCRVKGQTTWESLTKSTLRNVTAIAGLAVVLLPWFWRKRFGDSGMILASGLLATSPLLVYYSQMFIHESLLVFWGMTVVIVALKQPKWGILGFCIGMMFATKETFVISLMAWAGALVVIGWEERMKIERDELVEAWNRWKWHAAITCAVAFLTGIVIYTHGFSHMRGAVDAVRTFFVYETVSGHDKPLGYYFEFLLWPKKSAGMWWFGFPVCVLAGVAYAASFRQELVGKARLMIRFVAYSAIGHLVIYSFFSYKTPWLACLPLAHVCLLAGFSVLGFRRRGRLVQITILSLVCLTMASQWIQARRATGRLSSDARNPYAYVPTRKDVELLSDWLEKLKRLDPDHIVDDVAVIGSNYWPLPWYLRSFSQVGYWPHAVTEIEGLPLVFSMPDEADRVMSLLSETHFVVYRSLRADVPLVLFIRNDLWQQWIHH